MAKIENMTNRKLTPSQAIGQGYTHFVECWYDRLGNTHTTKGIAPINLLPAFIDGTIWHHCATYAIIYIKPKTVK